MKLNQTLFQIQDGWESIVSKASHHSHLPDLLLISLSPFKNLAGSPASQRVPSNRRAHFDDWQQQRNDHDQHRGGERQ